MKKLSDRALELLQLIDDYTLWEGDIRPGEAMIQYFVPSPYEMHCKTLSRLIDVHGPGDANILKMLARRGLTKEEFSVYSYSITEDGIAVLANEWKRIEAMRLENQRKEEARDLHGA